LNVSARDLRLPLGEAVALRAPSGAGKSVFMKGIADLLVNDGDLWLGNVARSAVPAPAWRSKVRYIGPKMLWWEETLKAHFEDQNWLKNNICHMDIALEAITWPVSRLSSGEAQRLCLLRALQGVGLGRECILLLDEPTSALDMQRTILVERFLQRFLDQKYIGILFSSHDDRQIDRFAQKIWEIDAGRVVER
jgi:phosphate-transporting ATPase